MRKFYFILSFFIPFILTAQTAPSIQWQKTLGGSQEDVARSIQQTSDGGYIVAGQTWSSDGDVALNHGLIDYWVVKLNSNGDISWKKSLGGSSGDVANSIQQTSDNGYIIAGYTYSKDGDVTLNHGISDCWIVKLNEMGDIQWQKSMGGSKGEGAMDIKQTSDDGYIIAALSNSNDGDLTTNHGNNDFWIIKTDSNGNIQWQKSLGGSKSDIPHSIQQTSDGGYIVAGSTEDAVDGDITESYGKRDSWIVKLNSNGNIQWQKTMGGIGDDHVQSIRQTSDGGYITAGGSTQSITDTILTYPQIPNYWIVKYSNTGEMQWQKRYGGSLNEGAIDIQETNDGGYTILGTSSSSDGQVIMNHGKFDYWIVKINNTGTIQWQKSLGGTGDDMASNIQKTSDGGFIISGHTSSNNGDITKNQGDRDYWIVKLAPEQREASNVIKIKLTPILYPNPARDFIYVERLPTDVPTEITITDMAGRKIFSQKYQEEKIRINTAAFPQAAYVIQVKIKDELIFSEKIIIRK